VQNKGEARRAASLPFGENGVQGQRPCVQEITSRPEGVSIERSRESGEQGDAGWEAA